MLNEKPFKLLDTMMEKHEKSIIMTQKQYLEMFSAAYIKHTNIPPDKAILVQQWEGTTIKWWFEEKKESV